MRLYNDNSYSREHEFEESPSVTIGSYVYVQVDNLNIATKKTVLMNIHTVQTMCFFPVGRISSRKRFKSRCHDG